jgi:cation/acetate symporter
MNSSEYWFLGISPEGIGFIGMLLNLFISFLISFSTAPPPDDIIEMIDEIRQP